jgi:hypothetical protein
MAGSRFDSDTTEHILICLWSRDAARPVSAETKAEESAAPGVHRLAADSSSKRHFGGWLGCQACRDVRGSRGVSRLTNLAGRHHQRWRGRRPICGNCGYSPERRRSMSIGLVHSDVAPLRGGRQGETRLITARRLTQMCDPRLVRHDREQRAGESICFTRDVR